MEAMTKYSIGTVIDALHNGPVCTRDAIGSKMVFLLYHLTAKL
jgi:hypothetical protein